MRRPSVCIRTAVVMGTLPRFRMPDESSSQNVSAAVTNQLAGLEFDDLDRMQTRVVERTGRTTLRKPLPPNSAGKSANVDDVVEELRAAAAGRSSKVRELTSDDLLEEIPNPDAFQEVDVSEILFDRVVARHEALWNVREAAHAPRVSILGPQVVRTRFIVTAVIAMAIGALFAVIVAVAIWRFSGLSI